jgi:D-inositol-3-phosphate glycosyltransferase
MNIYIREVSRHLSDLGVEVDVFTRRQGPEGPDVEPFASRARVIHVPAGPARYLPKEQVVEHLPEFICNMREFVQRGDADGHSAAYDLVHSHYWLSGRVGGYFKNAWRVPMVAMFHTLGELKNQVSVSPEEWEADVRVGIERLTVATADRVVASTRTDGDHLELYYGADGDHISVVPCGVDIQQFHPGDRDAARRALGLGDAQIVLFVGRIQQLKGIELLLRAIHVLAGREGDGEAPPFRAVIVGGRPTGDSDDPEAREFGRLKALSRELGVDNHVEWRGAVAHEELAQYYQAANVTVMPSTYESFGLVAVESMACGTPVVAARVGGLQATVQEGKTGFLIPWRDPAIYADRIGDILSDPEFAGRLGRAARARAMEFGWDRVATQLVDLYDELIQAQTDPRPAGALRG